MGFKFKRIDFVGGSTAFPADGYSYASKRFRSESVLKAFADALLAMNIGWRLDSSRGDSETTSDFANVPCKVGTNTYPGLFFKNTVSGCKLFMAYFGGTLGGDHCIKDFSSDALFGYGQRYICGLCVSFIPAGSTNEFGMTFDSSFLPADATRIIGTVFYHTDWSGNATNAGNPSSGTTYSWGLYASDSAIAVTSNRNTTTPVPLYCPVYAAGKIFGTLAHSSDNTNQAHYGVVIFRQGGASDPVEGTQGFFEYTIAYMYCQYPQLKMLGQNPWSDMNVSKYPQISAARADGTWANANYTTNVGSAIYPSEPQQLAGFVFNSTGTNKSRWIPFAATVLAADPDTYGIVPGDCFKGYLDTDLFRCGIGTYGQTFDNGNFICADGLYNFLIGWDSTNTDSIAG